METATTKKAGRGIVMVNGVRMIRNPYDPGRPMPVGPVAQAIITATVANGKRSALDVPGVL